MQNGPAFVLGNGPTLPVELLPTLQNYFTVGVNRILASGFEPTAVAWCDSEIYEECRADMAKAESLLVTTCRNHQRRARRHYVLKLRKSVDDAGRVAEWYASGSSGTAAARWCLALGFDPVYLLGCGCQYGDGGRTNFWGDNQRHSPRTTTMFENEMSALLHEYQHHVWRTDDSMVWRLTNPWTPKDWRLWLHTKMVDSGVEYQDP